MKKFIEILNKLVWTLFAFYVVSVYFHFQAIETLPKIYVIVILDVAFLTSILGMFFQPSSHSERGIYYFSKIAGMTLSLFAIYALTQDSIHFGQGASGDTLAIFALLAVLKLVSGIARNGLRWAKQDYNKESH